MNISYNWLCQLLPQKLSVAELSEILTSVGLEVEHIEEYNTVKGGLQGLVIGKVLTAAPHPDADKLQITTVDIGTGTPLQIVCGAPNAAAGQTVVVATVGTTLHPSTGEPFEIKKAKIRGIESIGMLCAEDEIGVGSSHDGIIVLPNDIAIGTAAKDFYNIPAPDYIYEIGLTPNRMDAMSHLGVAKDICAFLSNKNEKPYQPHVPVATLALPEQNTMAIDVKIENTEKCQRYCGITLSHVQVAPSPMWLQQQLQAIGVRPINNVVDITNYVLHECGQPLHAFDANKIAGNTIIVKTLPAGTKFTTLDDKERTLQASDAMVCDAEKALCIAGVFGGANSGVSNSTTTIFLESAMFDAHSTRLSSMHHGLRTDAAIRFEKGIDVSNIKWALQRATHLLCEIAGAKIASSITDIYLNPIAQKTITITYNYINKLSGANYSKEKIKNILTHLHFTIVQENENELQLSVPFAKTDISIPADIVEEIMRIDGIDNVPFTGKISFALSTVPNNLSAVCKNQVAHFLINNGCYEIFTNSITSSAFYENKVSLVQMINSLSSELDTLRPSMLETGLQAISHNVNRKNTDLLLYEIGKVYSQQNNKYIEEEKLCIYFSGNNIAQNWLEIQKPLDLYFVKGMMQSMYAKMGIAITFETNETGLLIKKKKQTLGSVQQVPTEKLKHFDIKQAVFFVECDWASLVNEVKLQKIKMTGIPKFPAMQRDLALVLDKKIQYAEVQKAISQANASLLKSHTIFDVFENEKLGLDKKSYAINMQFSDNNKTLTDAEVDADMKKIIENLEKKVQASIRS